MLEKIYYINGKYVSSENAKIPFTDAAFLYGDGLFETIRFQNRKLFHIKKHFDRLNNGLKILELNFNNTNEDVIGLLESLIDKNPLDSGLLRLMVTRGEVPDSVWEYTGPSNLYISIKPLMEIPQEPVKIIFYNEQNYPIIRFNPAVKSMNYIGNMKAKKDAFNAGAFEPVFYNKDKVITECAIRNIFFIKSDTIYTPSLDLGVLPGIMRSTIFDIASSKAIDIIECSIDFEDINSFDEAFISSSGIGILECYWTDWESNYKITKKIKKILADKLTNW